MNVCIVSDFFHPAVGGCEVHIYQLGSYLCQLGVRVTVLTHAVGELCGKVHLTSGIQVYYIPQLPMYNNTSFPTAFSTLPMLSRIFRDENIHLVHGHSAFSVLAHEALLHAQVMGIATCFTDHSLFGFSDASSILTNKLLQASLAGVHAVICVSHASKENTVLRAHLDPRQVTVIGNAIDPRKFQPNVYARDPAHLTIVYIARLELRKGADLLVNLIPRVCECIPNARFVIAGDGKKRPLLEEMLDMHRLRDRVELLGNISHDEVRSVLVRGDLFLNTSLTEAFCMAIVEASAAGLHVVSTNVGGIPEVLPANEMVSLAEPSVDDLLRKIVEAVPRLLPPGPQAENIAAKNHARVAQMYDWKGVAAKTHCVYEAAIATSKTRTTRQLLERYQEKCGTVWGKIFVIWFVIDYIMLLVTNFVRGTTMK